MGEFNRAVAALRIGRFYCPPCKKVGAVIRQAGVTEIRCPTCNGICRPAHLEESEEPRR